MKTLIISFLIFAGLKSYGQCVNFTKYQPAGWDGPIVISAITGTSTTEPLFYYNQTLYLDIAVQNNGSCNASQAVTAYVFLDGVYKTTLTFPVLSSGYYSAVQDFTISGSLGVGNHYIQVDIDGAGSVSETNEGDNTFTRSFTVEQGACVNSSVNTIFNGNQSFNSEHFQNTNFRVKDQCQSATIRVRDWNSSTTTGNPIEITSGNNSWTTQNQIFAGSTMWAIKKSYEYFKNVHSRNSWDGANGAIEAYINSAFSNSIPPNTSNATMLNGEMQIGLAGSLLNSFATLDIIGHEYTHDVTGTSAGLAYRSESGALNESFSDIFGECIENQTTGSNNWLLGSQRSPGNALRSMLNPNAFNDPDTYLGTNWASTANPSNSNDWGGVHTNSGVQNYWFYLLAQGGSGLNDNGFPFNVTGIGIEKARRIAFRTLTVNLAGQTNANYTNARAASILSAQQLFGVGSVEEQAVTGAWCAVGVGTGTPGAVTVSGGGTFCGSTIISASGGAGGTIYFQYGNSNGTLTTAPATSRTITTSGTYYFRAANGCGWGPVSSVTVTINTIPAAVSVSGAGTFCNSTTITASGGAGGTIYFQGTIPNNTFFGSTSLSQVPTSSGTYYFRSYNSCGWGPQGSATVTIESLPDAVSVTGGGEFCNTTTITASGDTGGTIYFQGTSPGGTSFGSTLLNQTVNSTGTYYFRSNNTCGWGPQGSANVTIRTDPGAVSVSGGGTFCNSAQLTATGGSGATIYWQGVNNYGTSQVESATSKTVYATGTYFFRAYNICGWGTPAGTSVTVDPFVPAAVTVNGGGQFCTTATLNASGGSGGTIYWQGNTNNGTSISSATMSQYVNTSGTYYFRAKNSCGWGPQGSATVTKVPNTLNLAGMAGSGLQRAQQNLVSGQQINQGMNVSYQAGKSIELSGDFKVESGGVFMAEIKECQ